MERRESNNVRTKDTFEDGSLDVARPNGSLEPANGIELPGFKLTWPVFDDKMRCFRFHSGIRGHHGFLVLQTEGSR